MYENTKKKIFFVGLIIILLSGIIISLNFYNKEKFSFINKSPKELNQKINFNKLEPIKISENSLLREGWKINASGLEKDLIIEYDILDENTTEFCLIPTNDYSSKLSLVSKDISDLPIEKINLESDLTINKTNFDLSAPNKDCFRVNYPAFEEGMSFKIGWNTVVVNSSTVEGVGNGEYSYNRKVFYDELNNRWHVVYLDSGSNIASHSSSDGTTWVNGTQIGVDSYSYDDFDCAILQDDTTPSLHCVYSDYSDDLLRYTACNLTGTDPYIVCGAEQVPFESSAQGGQDADDVAVPKLIIDNDNCLVIVFDFEDDSVSGNEHDIAITKENSTTGCGDGDWDGATDTAIGYPQFELTGTYYGTAGSLGFVNYRDSDGHIFTEDNTVSGSYDLINMYYNSTSNSVGAAGILDDDYEAIFNYHSNWAVTVNTSRVIVFGMDDGTTNLDAYIVDNKGNTLTSQVYTNTDMYFVDNPDNSQGAFVAGVVDTRSEGADDVYVFAVNPTDIQDIYSSNSTDGGITWGSTFLWVDEAGGNEIKYFSAYFNNETCDIMVTWLSGDASPWNVTIETLNTGTCEDETPPTYSDITVNSTIAGQAINFSVLWNDETALHPLGQYIFSTNNTGTWVNDSAINFTATPSFANVIKILNDTVGNVIGYRWFATDNAINGNETGLQLLTTTAADTCTPPGSGNWNVECDDNCTITSNYGDGTTNLSIEGVNGFFTILANITVDKLTKRYGCQLVNKINDGNELIIKK